MKQQWILLICHWHWGYFNTFIQLILTYCVIILMIISIQDRFAAEIIPQYFDHNKFSSFARQLNFYGFRKIQTKPIRNEDFDVSTAKYVTFFNEKFKRDRYDLLKEIQRSTRGGGNASTADQAREVERLRSRVATLEQRVQQLDGNMLDMKMKFDVNVQMACMNFLSGGGSQPSMGGMPNLPSMASSFSASDMGALSRAERSFGSIGRNPIADNTLLGEQAVRAFSSGSKGGGATLPPHPKQKQLPPLVGGVNDLRQASGGLQNNMNLAGMGLNNSGMNSSMLLRNAWEDKFFSTLMASEGGSRAASLAGMGMAGNNSPSLAALAAAQQMQARKNDQAAAFLEAQRISFAAGTNNGGSGLPALKRQTTAEILLEAAGEIHKKEASEISKV